MAGQPSKDYNSVNWNDIVYYDETSPTFLRWSVKIPRSKWNPGDVAGYINDSKGAHGYSLIKYSGYLYKAHRIVWVLHNGSIDNECLIDHIDGVRHNNAISNLRCVNDSINSRNRIKSPNGKCLVTGVSFTDKNNQPSFFAHWRDLDGKSKQKWFSCKVYGFDGALNLAIKYRESVIDELNSLGAGYSSRHGT